MAGAENSASITGPKRISEAREKLKTLKSQGYQYILTSDDGET